jgi:hypothetical protein
MTEKLLGPTAGRRRRKLSFFAGLAVSLAMVGALVVGAGASNQGGFEIDAGSVTATDALFSGNQGGNDWAKGSSGEGVFKLAASGSATGTAATNCYGSNIDFGGAGGTAALICDGNSDKAFKTSPEQNIVSPSGKTPDDLWPVKPGNVRPKNDFSHAYVYTKAADSPCTVGTSATDTILYLGGHVGDNEGDHFWGFEFDQVAPGGFNSLTANDGSSFTLDFNRTAHSTTSSGDFLVSFTVPGNTSDPVAVEVFEVTGFNADGSAIFSPVAAKPGCPSGQPQGLTELATNAANEITAPPWNIPVCDPTADNKANTCRLASSTTPLEDLIAPRDFAEASVDLAAFGINPCVNTVIFTSRSAHPIGGADIQDVGGATFPVCAGKSGTKFEDLNANGVKDTGESGLQGWTIKIYKDANGNGTLEDADDGTADSAFTTFRTDATTDSAGGYSFPALPNGNYIVCETAQPAGASGITPTTGWKESLPNANNTDKANCSAVTGLAAVGYKVNIAGVADTGNDFGNYHPAVKSGVKFNDLNANGVKDAGEPGLNGWTINAYKDTDGNGVRDNGETTVAATATTATVNAVVGSYALTLDPGKYVVCEVLQSTWKESKPSGNTICNGTTNNDLTTLGAAGYAVTIVSRVDHPNNDFGNFQQATIAGTKFKDINNNGAKDAGDSGLQGWTIHIYNDAGGTAGSLDATDVLVDTQTTDSSGNYTSASLSPGTYYVCEASQTGWVETYPKTGTTDVTDCTAKDGGKGYKFVTAGTNLTLKDFGNTPQSHITVGFVSDGKLFGGGDATKASSITCVDAASGSLADGDATGNGYLSPKVTLNQSSLVCTITFIDP